VGDIVGAGIYGTIGVAAGAMGNAVWLAFIASMVAAMLTGLTYASVSSRYPRAAGAAYVTQRAYRRSALSYGVGLAIMASGLTSVATAANVFAQNLSVLLGGFSAAAIKVMFLLGLTLINFRGIRESMWTNLLCTLVEVGGLVFVIAVSARFWGQVNYLEVPGAGASALGHGLLHGPGHGVGDIAGGGAALGLPLLLSGAVLTFYSFVGFEDMINVSEEVRDPRRNMPLGLILAVGIATLLYLAVAVSAVSVVHYRELADKNLGAPLVQITRRAAPWLHPAVFNLITLFAVANTALLNLVMGSRLAYGMARQGLLPRPLSHVHASRRTPHVAIVVLCAIAVALALAGNIQTLARSTSVLLLLVFLLVNGALLILKRRPGERAGLFEIPSVIPAAGVIVCAAMIAHARRPELTVAGILLSVVLVLYVVMRPRGTAEDDREDASESP